MRETSAIEEAELLREYIESHSEAAFAELVRRHVDLVYSTAFRVTSEPQMARDVAQEVFTRLARQAAGIRDRAALPAWLYRVARTQAVNAVRTEARRRHREEEAVRMSELETDTETVWNSLKPLLEEAMAKLGQKDQAALVLRFFAGKSLLEVGQALNVTDEAARKRVSRALEELRGFFARRGVAVSASVLASVLAANTVQAAPMGLAASLPAASLAGTTAAGSTGLATALIHTCIMSKVTLTLVTIIAAGAALSPLLLRKPRIPSPPVAALATEPGPASVPSPSPPVLPPVPAAKAPARPLLARVAGLPPLTREQVEAYVVQNKTNAESLLAAYRVTGDKAWLIEAATRYARNPEVQYAILATQAFPEAQRQWADAYKAGSPDNAIAWYFSALEYFKAGDKEKAVRDLAEGSRKQSFRAELASTLQAVEELHLNSGRAADEAKIVAFQACAQFPELPQMRELSKFIKSTSQEYRQRSDSASAEALAGMGLVLGAHLSEGGASQTVINQLVGMAIQKSFLQELPTTANDPFGRPMTEVSAAIEKRQAVLKEYSRTMGGMMERLEDNEWALYLERIKLYGEEAALAWLKEKHGP